MTSEDRLFEAEFARWSRSKRALVAPTAGEGRARTKRPRVAPTAGVAELLGVILDHGAVSDRPLEVEGEARRVLGEVFEEKYRKWGGGRSPGEYFLSPEFPVFLKRLLQPTRFVYERETGRVRASGGEAGRWIFDEIRKTKESSSHHIIRLALGFLRAEASPNHWTIVATDDSYGGKTYQNAHLVRQGEEAVFLGERQRAGKPPSGYYMIDPGAAVCLYLDVEGEFEDRVHPPHPEWDVEGTGVRQAVEEALGAYASPRVTFGGEFRWTQSVESTETCRPSACKLSFHLVVPGVVFSRPSVLGVFMVGFADFLLQNRDRWPILFYADGAKSVIDFGVYSRWRAFRMPRCPKLGKTAVFVEVGPGRGTRRSATLNLQDAINWSRPCPLISEGVSGAISEWKLPPGVVSVQVGPVTLNVSTILNS